MYAVNDLGSWIFSMSGVDTILATSSMKEEAALYGTL